MKRIIIPILVLVILLILILSGKNMLRALFGDFCSNEMVKTVPSPNEESIAYIFSRDCGATTSSSLQLSILNKEEEFQNESGNAFITEDSFSVVWVDDQHLEVTYGITSEIFEKDRKVNGVRIKYIGK